MLLWALIESADANLDINKNFNTTLISVGQFAQLLHTIMAKLVYNVVVVLTHGINFKLACLVTQIVKLVNLNLLAKHATQVFNLIALISVLKFVEMG